MGKVDDIEADEVCVLVLVFNAVECDHSMTEVEFINWLTCVNVLMLLLILSRMGFADESNFTLRWVDESAW